MWMWTLNWNEIRPDLVVGSCPMTPADLKRLRSKARITALLSLQHQECLDHHSIDYPSHERQGQRLQLTLVRSPMRDFDDEDQRRCLPDAVRALHTLLRNGHRVYIHCTAGINRSPLVILAYLNFVEGQPHSDAFSLIRRQRPQAAPSWEAFDGARQDLLEPHRASIRTQAAEIFRRGLSPDLDNARSRAEQQMIRTALGITAKPYPPDTPLGA